VTLKKKKVNEEEEKESLQKRIVRQIIRISSQYLIAKEEKRKVDLNTSLVLLQSALQITDDRQADRVLKTALKIERKRK